MEHALSLEWEREEFRMRVHYCARVLIKGFGELVDERGSHFILKRLRKACIEDAFFIAAFHIVSDLKHKVLLKRAIVALEGITGVVSHGVFGLGPLL